MSLTTRYRKELSAAKRDLAERESQLTEAGTRRLDLEKKLIEVVSTLGDLKNALDEREVFRKVSFCCLFAVT